MPDTCAPASPITTHGPDPHEPDLALQTHLTSEADGPNNGAPGGSPPPPPPPPDPREPVTCADGTVRPRWASRDPLVQRYHDTEWGIPVTEERAFVELHALFVFQVGLNWGLVLRRRDALRALFDHFDARLVAEYDEARVAAIAADPAGIRNPLKVRAVVANARATCDLAGEGGLLAFVQARLGEQAGPESARAAAVATALRARGFTYTGARNTWSWLQAAGLLPPAADPSRGRSAALPEPLEQ